MIRGSARRQALVVLGVAVLGIVAYAFLRNPVRVHWLVARGSPPAATEDAQADAADELRAMGGDARATLLGILHASGTPWDRRAWVAAILSREPFFARPELERALTAGPKGAARAAAFALLDGDRADPFARTLAQVHGTRTGAQRRAPGPPPWDPAPAVPVLLDWLADEADPSAGFAARLLGRIPPGDRRIPEALLAVLESAPRLLSSGPVTEAVGIRKFVVVDCIQSLLRYAPDHPEVVGRVCRVVAALGDAATEERGWDIQRYALDLLELSRGRGMDFDAVLPLAEGPNRVLRQKLAGVLGEIQGPVGPVLLRLTRDESPFVRRNAVSSMALRQDRELLVQVPYIVEDSHIFLRADAIRHAGDVYGVDPEYARTLVPLMVACLEEPWPGEPIPTYPQAHDPGVLEVMSAAMFSLKRLTGLHPGFHEDPKIADGEIADFRRREALAKRMLADEALRADILARWHAVTQPRPPEARLPFLVEHLGDRDPENVLRAMRELHRLKSRADGFPPEALRYTGDDTDARNAIREWMKTGREAAVAAWKEIVR